MKETKRIPLNTFSEKGMATFLVEMLMKEGHEAYFVGGCVRDFILKKSRADIVINDYDITTSASVEEIVKCLAKYARDINEVGKKFQVVVVNRIEIAKFRKETYKVQGKPDVEPARTFKEDASRRDFTVNAMAMTVDGEIIDFFGGMDDLEKGLIRFVGDPAKRIEDDPSRLLRACDIAARFNFSIEKQSMHAIQLHARQAQNIPSELVGKRLGKTIEHACFDRFLLHAKETQILSVLFPELDSLTQEEFSLTVSRVKEAQKSGSESLLFATAFAERADVAFEKLLLLDFGKETASETASLLSHVHTFLEGDAKETLFSLSKEVKGREELAEKVTNLFAFKQILHPDEKFDQQKEAFKALLDEQLFFVKELPLSGKDIMKELNLKAGKVVGDLLNHLVTCNIKDQKEALEACRSFLNNQ